MTCPDRNISLLFQLKISIYHHPSIPHQFSEAQLGQSRKNTLKLLFHLYLPIERLLNREGIDTQGTVVISSALHVLHSLFKISLSNVAKDHYGW